MALPTGSFEGYARKEFHEVRELAVPNMTRSTFPAKSRLALKIDFTVFVFPQHVFLGTNIGEIISRLLFEVRSPCNIDGMFEE